MKKPKRRGYVPSRNVRNHIYKWEASDIKAQNKKFGGDAIKAKAAEFNAMLGDYATRIGQDTADALFSTYYNISPNIFKERILPSVIDYAKNSTKENYNKVHDIMVNRYTWADKKYQRGIKRRAAADAALAKPIVEINYDDVVNDALEQPIDALRVETPKIIKPIKIKSTPIIQQEQEQTPIYLQKPETLPNIIDTWNNAQKGSPLSIPQFEGGKDQIQVRPVPNWKYVDDGSGNMNIVDMDTNQIGTFALPTINVNDKGINRQIREKRLQDLISHSEINPITGKPQIIGVPSVYPEFDIISLGQGLVKPTFSFVKNNYNKQSLVRSIYNNIAPGSYYDSYIKNGTKKTK